MFLYPHDVTDIPSSSKISRLAHGEGASIVEEQTPITSTSCIILVRVANVGAGIIAEQVPTTRTSCTILVRVETVDVVTIFTDPRMFRGTVWWA